MLEIRREKLRANGRSPHFRAALARLRTETAEAARIGEVDFAGARGQWTHLYHCHADGAALRFDWEQPGCHVCPLCGTVYAGEPFDGCWISIAHNRIAKAVYHAALLHAIEPDEALATTAKRYMLEYAEHYSDYAVHGEIPYNGPGKLFAQTLDEAHWMLDLAAGYSLLSGELAEEENSRIRAGLLAPCAEFLIAHKEMQIHNHAVLITSAIGALGILLGDDAVASAGLDGEYGLRDQIARGILGDGFWYEGSFTYHFYALRALLSFSLLAEGTAWDVRNSAQLKAMFDFPLRVVLPGGRLPALNDSGPSELLVAYASLYEAGLDFYGDTRHRLLLQEAYYGQEAGRAACNEEGCVTFQARDSLEALLYGGELPDTEAETGSVLQAWTERSFTSAESGLTKLVRPAGWHALLKHGPFGGEHDHLDRLGLQLGYEGRPVLTDPGTTAYGVPAHYGWFKHTLAHNAPSVGGFDQPPRDGRLAQAHDRAWGTWAESAVDWTEYGYRMQSSIFLPEELCPWDERPYAGVTFRRIVALADDLALDVVLAEALEAREFCLAQHIAGEWEVPCDAWLPNYHAFGAIDGRWLSAHRGRMSGPRETLRAKLRAGGRMRLDGWCSVPSSMSLADTPDNPPTASRATLIRSTQAVRTAMFVHAYRFEDEQAEPAASAPKEGLDVSPTEDGGWRIELRTGGGARRFRLHWHDTSAEFGMTDDL
ncbi:heparinase II/III domain-containing protein [Paenibacillus methanolicus]|uniref:Alginate lyase n=1 Tax=Paenibacillus methanolicus TaxID=582686 RepID=A0A5S5CKS1_9BACL|nr:heparinase II/III family protein [Paenibacillus methanolicus]TYP79141.1 alginate lyase [Paenibacillus methanolicus]